MGSLSHVGLLGEGRGRGKDCLQGSWAKRVWEKVERNKYHLGLSASELQPLEHVCINWLLCYKLFLTALVESNITESPRPVMSVVGGLAE